MLGDQRQPEEGALGLTPGNAEEKRDLNGEGECDGKDIKITTTMKVKSDGEETDSNINESEENIENGDNESEKDDSHIEDENYTNNDVNDGFDGNQESDEDSNDDAHRINEKIDSAIDNSDDDDSDIEMEDECGDESYTTSEDGGEDSKNISGLANVVAIILSTKKSENVILSKAKKDWMLKKNPTNTDDTVEVVDSKGQIKEEVKIKEEENLDPKSTLHNKEAMRRVWEKQFRVKPDVIKDYEKERHLKMLATQGVVQLFSAIEKHKNMIQKRLSETRSVMGREKVLETTGKEAFMQVLQNQGKKLKIEKTGEIKTEVKEEKEDVPAYKKPKWNIFTENFYKEPTLQGWDQDSDA